jgi:hypothetical protein
VVTRQRLVAGGEKDLVFQFVDAVVEPAQAERSC